MKHTWYKANTSNGQGLIVSEENGENIAVTYKEANAHLIAAAPELLEALKKAKTAFETLEKWGKVPMEVVMLKYGINELNDVIKKAEGK